MRTTTEPLLTEADVTAYLVRHGRKDMLRFLTAGSVDDGKSTLIGRLLIDAKLIYEDQLAAVVADSAVHGTTGAALDPALLTDGLKAEREQGITIDVAYRYFSTDQRNFIIADTPGHAQYTRNMATGASTCDLAIILIDARYGVVEQTRRHSFIAALLGIRRLVVCVNKMDLVDYSQEVFERIRADYEGFAAKLEDIDLFAIPISALRGDNVVEASPRMPWFQGGTLLYYLETAPVSTDRNLVDMRFPVQYVARPDAAFRGYAGTVASGILRVGDEVVVLPSRARTRVASIRAPEGDVAEAFAPMAVMVTLADAVDVSRGEVLAHVNNQAAVSLQIEASLVWMHETPLRVGGTYWLRSACNSTPATVTQLHYRFDVNTLHRLPADTLPVNGIGRVALTAHRPIVFDPYRQNRAMGCFVLIDRDTHATVAGGMALSRRVAARPAAAPRSADIVREPSLVTAADRETLLHQKPVTVWLTGLSGSGKSTLAKHLERRLVARGHTAFVLDGDNVRHGLCRDLGFSVDDRVENIRRVAEVARLFNDAGMIVLTSFISPYRGDRERVRETVGAGRVIEVYVDASLEVCEARDPKGLYRKARAGDLLQFTGIDAPYEAPLSPDVRLATAVEDVDACVDTLLAVLEARGIIPAAKRSSPRA